MRRLLLLVALAVALGACASSREGSSEREWARAECNRIIDREARHRCLRRVDEDYGGSREEKETKDGKGRR